MKQDKTGQLTPEVLGHRVLMQLKCHIVVHYRTKLNVCPTTGLTVRQAREVDC